jgi:hypothetical protein
MSTVTTTPAVVAGALVFVIGLPSAGHAQRGRGATGEKPKVDIVQSVGCAERRSGAPESWWLTRAVDPRVTQPGLFNTNQVDEARKASLGSLSFQLVGVTDFLTPEELLKSGQRREFTTPETANATGQLRHGHKVLVKGMLIDAPDQKRINLLSVVGLADTCQ